MVNLESNETSPKFSRTATKRSDPVEVTASQAFRDNVGVARSASYNVASEARGPHVAQPRFNAFIATARTVASSSSVADCKAFANNEGSSFVIARTA